MATPKAKVFPQTVTDLTRQKDFLRAGIAHEKVVTDNEGKLVMIGIGKWRRPLTRIACEDAEGRVVDLHAMRTTLGTNLARAGVAPQLAQRIMRHADYRTTHKHYTVLSLTDTAKAIERLPAIKQPSQQTAKANGTTGECLTDDPQQSGRKVAQSGATRCDEPSKKPPSGGSRKSGGGRTLRDRVPSRQFELRVCVSVGAGFEPLSGLLDCFRALGGDTGLELCPYSPRNTQILNQAAQNAAHLLSHQGSAMAIWLN